MINNEESARVLCEMKGITDCRLNCGYVENYVLCCKRWTTDLASYDNGAIYVDEYEKDVLRTWNSQGNHDADLGYATLKLAGEAGELANTVGKYLYQGHELEAAEVVEEIGDQLYYMFVIMQLYGVTLDDVIKANIEKRVNRYPNGFDPTRSVNRKG